MNTRTTASPPLTGVDRSHDRAGHAYAAAMALMPYIAAALLLVAFG